MSIVNDSTLNPQPSTRDAVPQIVHLSRIECIEDRNLIAKHLGDHKLENIEIEQVVKITIINGRRSRCSVAPDAFVSSIPLLVSRCFTRTHRFCNKIRNSHDWEEAVPRLKTGFSLVTPQNQYFESMAIPAPALFWRFTEPSLETHTSKLQCNCNPSLPYTVNRFVPKNCDTFVCINSIPSSIRINANRQRIENSISNFLCSYAFDKETCCDARVVCHGETIVNKDEFPDFLRAFAENSKLVFNRYEIEFRSLFISRAMIKQLVKCESNYSNANESSGTTVPSSNQRISTAVVKFEDLNKTALAFSTLTYSYNAGYNFLMIPDKSGIKFWLHTFTVRQFGYGVNLKTAESETIWAPFLEVCNVCSHCTCRYLGADEGVEISTARLYAVEIGDNTFLLGCSKSLSIAFPNKPLLSISDVNHTQIPKYIINELGVNTQKAFIQIAMYIVACQPERLISLSPVIVSSREAFLSSKSLVLD